MYFPVALDSIFIITVNWLCQRVRRRLSTSCRDKPRLLRALQSILEKSPSCARRQNDVRTHKVQGTHFGVLRTTYIPKSERQDNTDPIRCYMKLHAACRLISVQPLLYVQHSAHAHSPCSETDLISIMHRSSCLECLMTEAKTHSASTKLMYIGRLEYLIFATSLGHSGTRQSQVNRIT